MNAITTIPTEVRLADENDEMSLYVLCKELWNENGDHSLSWPKIVANIRLATQRTRGIIGCIGPSDDIRGAVCLLLDQLWFSEDWYLLELFNYVRPDARRSSYAKDLINYSKSISEEMKLELRMGVISNIRTEAKVRLYRRMMKPRGAFFSHAPKEMLFPLRDTG